ncbi:uncharacterized protein [Struthio camelus]|uniref:uncharacterized protein isoform X2 n=1 Tax=Struthio camelus TaxID=8801 RepID=UPI00360424C0
MEDKLGGGLGEPICMHMAQRIVAVYLRTAGDGRAPSAEGKPPWILFENDGLTRISAESPQLNGNKIKRKGVGRGMKSGKNSQTSEMLLCKWQGLLQLLSGSFRTQNSLTRQTTGRSQTTTTSRGQDCHEER